jgi:hypothetical protein
MHHKHIGGIAFLIVTVLFGGLALIAYRIEGAGAAAVYYTVVGVILAALIAFGVWIAGRLTHRADATKWQPMAEASAPVPSQPVDSERL